MRGLYINIKNKKKVYAALEELGIKYNEYTFPDKINDDGFVIYDPQEWDVTPVYQDDNLFIAVYGWFVYKGCKNNLNQLAKDYIMNGFDIFNEIEGGIFTFYFEYKGRSYIVNDLFSLSMHFIKDDDQDFIVAPFPYYIDNKKINNTFMMIINKQKHLFGNFTGYENIKRLNPGSIYKTPTSYFSYYLLDDINSKNFSSEKLIKDFKLYTNFWDYEERIIPISGGIDSRFMLANSKFKTGYCYGPSTSGDRKVADNFRWAVDEMATFSLKDMEKVTKEQIKLINKIFNGLTSDPLPGLFFAFKNVKSIFPDSVADYDGFLGGVLQREEYVTFGTNEGHIYKLFPKLFYSKIDDTKIRKIIRNRYRNLNENEFRFLYDDFLAKTSSLQMTKLNKWKFYEIFYGRGTRYIIHGGITMKSQFFTVVPMFCFKPIFENFMSLDNLETVSFQSLGKIWKPIDEKFSKLKTDLGYTPAMSPFYARASKLANSLIRKRIAKEKDFGDELREI